MVQAEAQDRQVNRLRDAREWIGTLWSQSASNQHNHQDWDQRNSQNGGRTDCQGLGPRQRAEHASFLSFEQKDRQEGNDDDEQRKEERRADLPGCVDENRPTLWFRYWVSIVFLPFR